MSIIDNRRDRQIASAKISAMKDSIRGLQAHIDMIFRARPLPPVNTAKALAEIDYHLTAALIELDYAQERVNRL